jgi:hypothetical protein
MDLVEVHELNMCYRQKEALILRHRALIPSTSAWQHQLIQVGRTRDGRGEAQENEEHTDVTVGDAEKSACPVTVDPTQCSGDSCVLPNDVKLHFKPFWSTVKLHSWPPSRSRTVSTLRDGVFQFYALRRLYPGGVVSYTPLGRYDLLVKSIYIGYDPNCLRAGTLLDYGSP